MIMNIIMIIDTFNTSMNKYHDYKQRCKLSSIVYGLHYTSYLCYFLTSLTDKYPTIYNDLLQNNHSNSPAAQYISYSIIISNYHDTE